MAGGLKEPEGSGMDAQQMWRLLSEHGRLWQVRDEWFPPSVELTARVMDEAILSSTIDQWKDGRWWLFTSYCGSVVIDRIGAGGKRVFQLHPDPGMTLLQALNRAGGPLDRENREFVVIDFSENVQRDTIVGPTKFNIRRVTLYRPPDGHRTFNYLLKSGK